MTLGVAASLCSAVALGLLAIASLGGTTRRGGAGLLAACLAVGVGLGLSAVAFFVSLFLLGGPSPVFPVAELALVLLLGGGLWTASRRRHPPSAATDAPGYRVSVNPTRPPWLAPALLAAVACAGLAFALQAAANPQGGWDAWMTWNMHARALFRGGDRWREVLRSLPAWSHPDYPLLLPASIARIWTYAGGETALAPVVVAMFFTFATVGLLYAATAVLRSRTQAALGALLLLGTKFFLLHGASEFADIPLAFFFLATLVLLALPAAWPHQRPRLLLLAGLTAGLAAWTKNEGLLFLVAVPIGYGVAVGRTAGWRGGLMDARSFAVGLAPLLVLVLGFKIWLAPPNDLMADHGLRQTAARLFDEGRFVAVAGGFWRAFLEVGARGLTGLLLLGYWTVAGSSPSGPGRSGAKTAGIVVLLMLAGYAAVLLTAPPPLLATNIRSINRLLLQVWPSMLFAYLLAVRTMEEAGVVDGRRTARERRGAVPSSPSLGEPS